jgi:hypothetical protein
MTIIGQLVQFAVYLVGESLLVGVVVVVPLQVSVFSELVQSVYLFDNEVSSTHKLLYLLRIALCLVLGEGFSQAREKEVVPLRIVSAIIQQLSIYIYIKIE